MDIEKIKDKIDVKEEIEKKFNRKIIISQVVIILIFIVEVLVLFYQDNTCLSSSSSSSLEISTFNSQWEAYIGTNTATQVKTMYSAICSSNANEQKSGTERYVGIYFDPSLEIEVDENAEISVEYGVAPTSSGIEIIDTKQRYTVTAIYGENYYIIGMKVEQSGGNE